MPGINKNLNSLLAHSETILLVFTILGGWVYHLIRGDRVDSTRSMLGSLVREVIHAENINLDDPNVRANIVQLVTDKAEAWLAERKITGALADHLVKEAVAAAVAELAHLVSQRAMIKEALGASSMTTKSIDRKAPPPVQLPAQVTKARSPAAGKIDKLGRDLVLRWRQYLLPHADGTEDLGFTLGWILNESGGDPCSEGGGTLDEIGIPQFNVPVHQGVLLVNPRGPRLYTRSGQSCLSH